MKRIFKDWDRDGSGVISQENLVEVLQGVTELAEEDVQRLMLEMDTNCNGVIEYNEFVDWLMRPPEKSKLRALLDYSSILRPLFDVFDRNGDGWISKAEFSECHKILQSAIRAYVREEGGAVNLYYDPLDLGMESEEAFDRVDSTKDGVLTFRDFTEWMHGHLTRCEETPRQQLLEATQKIARLLAGTIKSKALAGCNPLPRISFTPDPEESRAMERIMNNLGKATVDFKDIAGQCRENQHTNVWSQPPVGLSSRRLRMTHIATGPPSNPLIADESLDTLCVPCPGGENKPNCRPWLGKVTRHFTLEGRRFSEAPEYYEYCTHNFQWEPLPDDVSEKKFEDALDRLGRDAAIFCALKTEADFGRVLDWPGICTALNQAADLRLISRSQVEEFQYSVEEQIHAQFNAEGLLDCCTPTAVPSSGNIMVQTFLEQKLRLAPGRVMAKLCEMGFVQAGAIWDKFTDDKNSWL